MAKIGYFATYARFDTVDKEAAAAFLGADNIVGDTFTKLLLIQIKHGSLILSVKKWAI